MASNSFLMQQFWMLPELFMCGLGAILALINMKKYPLAAGCALGAFVLWVVAPVVSQMAFYAFVISPSEAGSAPRDGAEIMNLIRGVTILMNVTAYGLILFALFAPRHESRGY